MLSPSSFSDVLSQAKSEDRNGQSNGGPIGNVRGFVYTVKIGKKTGDDNYHLKVSVANIPKERTPGKDGSLRQGDARQRNSGQVQRLEEAETGKACEKWTYLVGKWTVDPVLKERRFAR